MIKIQPVCSSRQLERRGTRHALDMLWKWTVLVSVAMVLMSVATPGRTATATVGGTDLPEQPSPSFTPHAGITGAFSATGFLKLRLTVMPSCMVVMPNRNGSSELASIRLHCTNDTVWLANLVPKKLQSTAFIADPTFISLRFKHQADGHVPELETPSRTPLKFGETRLNLDY